MGLIGSAIGAVGSIFGGIKASKAMKKAKRNVEAQRQKNQDWYDRRYNEDATQRADAQRILTQTEESIKQRNKAAAGSAAVMGGTDESVAAAKEANNKALADATSQIAADAEARKTISKPLICKTTMLSWNSLTPLSKARPMPYRELYKE